MTDTIEILFNSIFLIISFILGIFATQIRDWINKRKETKRINELFISFFEGITLLNTPLRARMNSLVIIQRIGKKLIMEKLGMVYYQYFEPSEKTNYQNENLTQNIIVQDPKKLKIRIFNEKWDILMAFLGLFITDYSKNPIGENQFRFMDGKIDPKSNEKTLIGFLKFLEEKYQSAGIIRKSEKLLNDEIINKIQNEMNNIREVG